MTSHPFLSLWCTKRYLYHASGSDLHHTRPVHRSSGWRVRFESVEQQYRPHLGRPDRVILTPDLQRRDTAVGDQNVPLPLTCEVIGRHRWLRGGIADGAHDESATLSGVGVRTSKMATADCAAPRTM